MSYLRRQVPNWISALAIVGTLLAVGGVSYSLSPFKAAAGVQLTPQASWTGGTGVPGLYYKTGQGLQVRNIDNTESAVSSSGLTGSPAISFNTALSLAWSGTVGANNILWTGYNNTKKYGQWWATANATEYDAYNPTDGTTQQGGLYFDTSDTSIWSPTSGGLKGAELDLIHGFTMNGAGLDYNFTGASVSAQPLLNIAADPGWLGSPKKATAFWAANASSTTGDSFVFYDVSNGSTVLGSVGADSLGAALYSPTASAASLHVADTGLTGLGKGIILRGTDAANVNTPVAVDTVNTYTGVSALFSVRNAGAQKAAIDATGRVYASALDTLSAVALTLGGSATSLDMASSMKSINFSTAFANSVPTFTSRSTGQKLTLYPAISGSTADYAIGVDNATAFSQWFGVPSTGYKFQWFVGITELFSMNYAFSYPTLTAGAGQTMAGLFTAATTGVKADDAVANGVQLFHNGVSHHNFTSSSYFIDPGSKIDTSSAGTLNVGGSNNSSIVLRTNNTVQWNINSSGTFYPNVSGNGGIGSSSFVPFAIYSQQYGSKAQTVPAATSVTINPQNGELVRVTLSATAITTMTVSAGISGQVLKVEVIEDATGTRTIPTTWTNVVFPGGTYTRTATASKRDLITLVYDDVDSKWYATVSLNL